MKKKKKYIMTEKEAHLKLYAMWEDGEVPSNFTEDHSLYHDALTQMMELGYIIFTDFF